MKYIIIVRQSQNYKSYWYLIDIPFEFDKKYIIDDVKKYLLDNHIYLDISDIDHISFCESDDVLTENWGVHGSHRKKIYEELIKLSRWKYFDEIQNPFFNIKNVEFLGYKL